MSDLRIHIPNDLFAPAAYQEFSGTYEPSVLKAGPDLYTFARPVTWSVSVSNVGDALLVTGTAEGDAKTSCARCLDDVELSLFGEVEGYFLIGEESEAPEDMDDDEFDVLPDDHYLDLRPLIEAALLLDIPLIPLCDDACKGLCPNCGANLNEGACSCPSEEEDPFAEHPFAALKDYQFKEAE